MGNSIFSKEYTYLDKPLQFGTIYYRLKQTDYNGDFEYFNMITIKVSGDLINKNIVKITNLLGEDVTSDYNGLIIVYYQDHTYLKIIKY